MQKGSMSGWVLREWTFHPITPARLCQHSSQTLLIWTPFSLEKAHQGMVLIWTPNWDKWGSYILWMGFIMCISLLDFILKRNVTISGHWRTGQFTCPRRHRNKIQNRVECTLLPDSNKKAKKFHTTQMWHAVTEPSKKHKNLIINAIHCSSDRAVI